MINNDTPLLVEDFNDEFNNVMDEMYDFYIFGRDYYLSLREQFTADLIRDYVNNEQVIMEGTFTNTIKKIIDGIIKFIKTMWRKFIGLFTKASKNVIDKANNDDDGGSSISDHFKKAVKDKDKLLCKEFIKNSLIFGRNNNFEKSDTMLQYAKSKIPSFMDSHNNEYHPINNNKKDWDDNYETSQLVALPENFSQERYDHIKKVILYTFSKPDQKEENKETITGYNYLKIIQGMRWKDVKKMCNNMYSSIIRKSKDIDMSIRRILTKWDLVYPNIEDPEKYSKDESNNYKNPYAEILFVFGAKDINDISKTDIRDYIFRGEKQESLNINKKYTDDIINTFKSEINNIEKDVKTHEKDLKDIISVLEKMKNNIQKDVKSLDQYKQDANDKKYYDSDQKMQKIIINFLKQVQKIVNESITFEARVVQTQLSILNKGITFVKSNS